MTEFLTVEAAPLLLALAGPAPADAIDAYVRAQMAKNHIPAVSVAVVRDGTVSTLMFGRSARYWSFDITPEGKIASLRPVSE